MTEENTEKKKVSEATKQEYKRLLAEQNTLYFRCDCTHQFKMEQPKGKYVRSNHETNFLIPWNDEHGKHTPIKCPKCGNTNGIRRVAPRWNPSTGNHHHRTTPLDNLKRMDNIVENDC
jgi:hypothetical protein